MVAQLLVAQGQLLAEKTQGEAAGVNDLSPAGVNKVMHQVCSLQPLTGQKGIDLFGQGHFNQGWQSRRKDQFHAIIAKTPAHDLRAVWKQVGMAGQDLRPATGGGISTDQNRCRAVGEERCGYKIFSAQIALHEV